MWRVEGSILSKPPQTYLEDKSTKTALYEVLKMVKGSLYSKQHTLADFPDVGDGLNNIGTIMKALTRIKLKIKNQDKAI